MAPQHLDMEDLLVKLQSTDPISRDPVKRDQLRGHRSRILEARGAYSLDFDAQSR